MDAISAPLAYARARRHVFVEELKEFVRFPTISAQAAHADDLRRCAAWLARGLERAGLERVKVIPTGGHPAVYAEWRHAPGCPNLLIYGHYDVQPPGPIGYWRSPPFEPVVRDAHLYGRGASDDKGQLLTHVKAIESYLQTWGRLPVNVQCLFEGEEEIGSRHLPALLTRHADLLTAGVAVLSDTRMLGPGRPAITYALRGALSVDLEVRGAADELHAGTFGGAIHNPLQALCDIIAKLHHPDGRIAIPGFYADVRRWNEDERIYMARVGPEDRRIVRNARVQLGWGERGYSLYERTTIRPALIVNGLSGGYQGPGIKAVIPSRATAKLNFRLVPDQDARAIERLFREWIARVTPPTVRTRVQTRALANPALVARGHPALRAAAVAYRRGFGVAPVLLRSGGTIPVVNLLQELLGISSVLMGFALPDDNLHAPNERFHLPNFFQGIATSIHFMREIARRAGTGDRAPPTVAAERLATSAIDAAVAAVGTAHL